MCPPTPSKKQPRRHDLTEDDGFAGGGKRPGGCFPCRGRDDGGPAQVEDGGGWRIIDKLSRQEGRWMVEVGEG